MVKADWVVCPCCGLNRKLNKSGKYHQSKIDEPPIEKSPSRSSFGVVELGSGNFIQVRDCSGGRGGAGFPIVDRINLKQASSIKEYQDLLQQIDDFCTRWIKFRKNK